MVGSTNVDCLLLYRPRLVRDQTPNTRRPGSQEACQKGSIHTTHHLKSMLLASKKEYRTKVHWWSPVSVLVPVARPESPVPPAQSHAGRACKEEREKKLLPKMDSDKTTGPCGLSGSSQCPAVLIRGLRKFPPSGGTQTTKRRGSLQKKAARPARVARLDDARRVGAAQPFACPNFHPGPIQASPGQPFRFVGHLRSARWAPACPITIRCLGLAPQAEQIADVLTPAYQAAPCIHTPRDPTPDP